MTGLTEVTVGRVSVMLLSSATALLIIGLPVWVGVRGMPPYWGIPITIWIAALAGVRFLSDGLSGILAGKSRRQNTVLRKEITAHALDQLALAHTEHRPLGIETVQQKVLEAVCCHVMHRIGQTALGTVSANLLVPEGDNLVVVARWGNQRPVPTTHHKTELFCARVLEGEKTISVGDIRLRYPEVGRDKEYRDILAVPLVGLGGESPHVGIVTVDCKSAYVFSGKQKTLAVGLSPYMNLLKLTVLMKSRRKGEQEHGTKQWHGEQQHYG